MKIDEYSRVSITESEAFEALYTGKLKNLDSVFIDGDINLYNQAKNKNADSISDLKELDNLGTIDKDSFDCINQKNWFMPEEYKNMDIEGFLSHVCPKENYQRMNEELVEFKKRNMLDLLRYLKYLVDTMRQNKVVWGVGRGSSVASYVLYLIGVHKIDSIKYKLDIKEFLKEN